MKLRSNQAKTFAMGAMATIAMFPAHAGSGGEVLEAALRQYQAVNSSTEWQNAWMPQASANAVAMTRWGDLQMGEIVAGYIRPLLAEGVGSGATSAAAEHVEVLDQSALL